MRTLERLSRLMRSIHWHLCEKFPWLMTCPDWHLRWLEFKWTLTPKRFSTEDDWRL